jgi:hypothetical protein
MRRLFTSVLLSLAAGHTASADPRSNPPRAVLELFTSQGCSSCPPADRLMTAWARDPGLVALSYPVDYWDYLGWKDTLAKHDFSVRQQAYAQSRGDRDVYTPQMVVNGLVHVVGSDDHAVQKAITATTAKPDVLTVPVGIADSPGGYIVAVGPGPGKGGIWLVPIEKSARVKIGRGENDGATVTYSNVARGLRSIGQYEGRPVTLVLDHGEVSAGGADGFAILVQAQEGERSGPILGAGLHPR